MLFFVSCWPCTGTHYQSCVVALGFDVCARDNGGLVRGDKSPRHLSKAACPWSWFDPLMTYYGSGLRLGHILNLTLAARSLWAGENIACCRPTAGKQSARRCCRSGGIPQRRNWCSSPRAVSSCSFVQSGKLTSNKLPITAPYPPAPKHKDCSCNHHKQASVKVPAANQNG